MKIKITYIIDLDRSRDTQRGSDFAHECVLFNLDAITLLVGHLEDNLQPNPTSIYSSGEQVGQITVTESCEHSKTIKARGKL